MAKWYHAGAKVHGVPMQYEEACERVYGEPYGDWKKKNQKKASHSVEHPYSLKEQNSRRTFLNVSYHSRGGDGRTLCLFFL